MPQRILVLGASGYIGQHLVHTLSQQGHQILAAARHVDRLAKLQLDNLPALLQDIDTVYFSGAQHGRRRRFYRSGAPGGSQRPRCAT